MIKIFTMVKDEADIVEDWIIYHASIFGYDNIYVIDNYSSDGTYEILQKYVPGINLYRERDYKKKGEFMTNHGFSLEINDNEYYIPFSGNTQTTIQYFINTFYDKFNKYKC